MGSTPGLTASGSWGVPPPSPTQAPFLPGLARQSLPSHLVLVSDTSA